MFSSLSLLPVLRVQIFEVLPDAYLSVLNFNEQLMVLDHTFPRVAQMVRKTLLKVPSFSINLPDLLGELDMSPLTDNLDQDLFDASKSGRIETVKLLMADGNVGNTEITLAILNAAGNDRTEVVKFLLNISKDLPLQTTLPLLSASYNGYIEIMRLIFEDGRADPTFDNFKAMRTALEMGRIKVARLLLAHSMI